MQRIQLFAQEERQGIENRYEGSNLYEYLRGAFHRMGSHAVVLGLHPTEGFYHVMCTVDFLRSMDRRNALIYCHNELTGDLEGYFREHTPALPDEDKRLAVSTILQGTAELLLRSGQPQWTSIAGALKLQVEKTAPELVSELNLEFSRGFRYYSDEEVAGCIGEYLDGESVISLEIDAMLESISVEELWQTRARRAGWMPPVEGEDNPKLLCESQIPAYGNTLTVGGRQIGLPANAPGGINFFLGDQVNEKKVNIKDNYGDNYTMQQGAILQQKEK